MEDPDWPLRPLLSNEPIDVNAVAIRASIPGYLSAQNASHAHIRAMYAESQAVMVQAFRTILTRCLFAPLLRGHGLHLQDEDAVLGLLPCSGFGQGDVGAADGTAFLLARVKCLMETLRAKQVT